MRIALLHYAALPVLGGVEIVLDAHARLLSGAGHEVRIICAKGGSRSEGITLWPLTPTSPTTTAQTRCEELHRALADCDIAILHNVGTMPFDMALTEALWEVTRELPATRFICWIHDIVACNPDYRLPSLGEHPWRLLATAHPLWQYVSVSDLRALQWSELTGLPLAACTVIPNGVDVAELLGLTPRIGALMERFHLLERDVVLLHPTRLLHRKNVELGLEVTAALRSLGVSVAYLVTAASDPHSADARRYASGLRELHSDLKLEDAAFFLQDGGPVTTQDLTSLYAIADALFFPSRQEGFGLPMLEAALHRLPAFCADVEPLRSLPGAIPFPLDAPPENVAAMIIHQMGARPANLPRKAVARKYAWPAIYRNFLAPLLDPTKTNAPT